MGHAHVSFISIVALPLQKVGSAFRIPALNPPTRPRVSRCNFAATSRFVPIPAGSSDNADPFTADRPIPEPAAKPVTVPILARPVRPHPSLCRVSLKQTHPFPLSEPRALLSAHIRPIYSLRGLQFSNNTASLTASSYWRFILLSDGHIVQHLSILTRGQVNLKLLSTHRFHVHDSNTDTWLPDTEKAPSFESGVVRRTIALTGPHGFTLLYAKSTWSADMYREVMAGREERTLWEVFQDLKLRVSRGILAVHFGTCDELCDLFGVEKGSSMWARDYVFRRGGRPFLIVHEVFSPRMARYLGEIIPPGAVLKDRKLQASREDGREKVLRDQILEDRPIKAHPAAYELD